MSDLSLRPSAARNFSTAAISQDDFSDVRQDHRGSLAGSRGNYGDSAFNFQLR